MAVKFQIGLSDKMKLQQMAAGIDDANAWFYCLPL